MKQLCMLAGTAAILTFGACTSNANKQLESKDSSETVISDTNAVDTTHTSQNSLDWAGTYSGVFPCADCPGIKTTVTLNSDETFTYEGEYQERDTKIEDTGKFMWHEDRKSTRLNQSRENLVCRLLLEKKKINK